MQCFWQLPVTGSCLLLHPPLFLQKRSAAGLAHRTVPCFHFSSCLPPRPPCSRFRPLAATHYLWRSP
ncbi:hypothetical protein 2209_scaffold64_00011 [Bacteriophage sp.]|nr:hypothetical protein 2209_scaffold64_00011 [Bacteriophage sp.]